MENIKTLKDLTPGTVFDAGPIDVRVLDHMTNGTTLLIADKAVAWRPFSLEPLKTRPEEAPTPYPNDFSLSYLKDELNGPFLAAFDAAGGPIRSANIVEADWSLADHRGGFGYGNMKAKISLLPEALFLKYKALLALDDWWWLVTPYAGNAYYARNVSADGSLDNNYAYSGATASGRLSSRNLESFWNPTASKRWKAMNNPVTTREWIGRRRLRASVDRTLGVKVPKAVFDEAEAYARRKMAFQNEALGLDRGDEYLKLLIPDVIREMALAARYDGRRATA
jgi:hypothetical protein